VLPTRAGGDDERRDASPPPAEADDGKYTDRIDGEAWMGYIADIGKALLSDDKFDDLKKLPCVTNQDMKTIFDHIAGNTTKQNIDTLMTANQLATHGSKPKCVERLIRFVAGL
jgi:hypothetical protein